VPTRDGSPCHRATSCRCLTVPCLCVPVCSSVSLYTALCHCTLVQCTDLSYNALTGPIPAIYGRLIRLKNLYVPFFTCLAHIKNSCLRRKK